ncbi:hypothetical protein [Kingella potus]|nr:hypothetical protein [Kingella potus]UOP00736.1 hypothetical protein LVJ84_13310 [Kingella potus]
MAEPRPAPAVPRRACRPSGASVLCGQRPSENTDPAARAASPFSDGLTLCDNRAVFSHRITAMPARAARQAAAARRSGFPFSPRPRRRAGFFTEKKIPCPIRSTAATLFPYPI